MPRAVPAPFSECPKMTPNSGYPPEMILMDTSAIHTQLGTRNAKDFVERTASTAPTSPPRLNRNQVNPGGALLGQAQEIRAGDPRRATRVLQEWGGAPVPSRLGVRGAYSLISLP